MTLYRSQAVDNALSLFSHSNDRCLAHCEHFTLCIYSRKKVKEIPLGNEL